VAVIVSRQFRLGMTMIVLPVFSGMAVRVAMLIARVRVLMRMLVLMRMRVFVGMFMSMSHTPM